MLDKTRLAAAIKLAMETETTESEPEKSLNRFAENLAGAIIKEILQLQLDEPTGLFAGSTPVTGTLNIKKEEK